MAVLKCLYAVSLKCSRYRYTSVSDPLPTIKVLKFTNFADLVQVFNIFSFLTITCTDSRDGSCNMSSCYFIKRPARDACLCMGELPAPPALPAPHFVFLITL